MTSRKVLFVGSGLTSAVAASQLKLKKESLQIIVWDKSKGAGGRMSTSRSPSNSGCQADVGAQYITFSPKLSEKHSKFFDALLLNGVLKILKGNIEGLRPLPEGTINYVAPSGSNSIVKHFLNKTDLTIVYDQLLVSLTVSNGGWKAVTSLGEESGPFDAVVLTMPVPQILNIKGDLSNLLKNQPHITTKLQSVTYSSRYALVLFYDNNDSSKMDLPWVSKYFPDNPIIRYISMDNIKRGQPNCPLSIVVHSSIDFGKEYLETDKEKVEPILLKELENLLPNLPKADSIKCHRWRYSQVLEAYENKPGCVMLQKDPLLLVAGDGFVASGFDGCLQSGLKVSEIISDIL